MTKRANLPHRDPDYCWYQLRIRVKEAKYMGVPVPPFFKGIREDFGTEAEARGVLSWLYHTRSYRTHGDLDLVDLGAYIAHSLHRGLTIMKRRRGNGGRKGQGYCISTDRVNAGPLFLLKLAVIAHFPIVLAQGLSRALPPLWKLDGSTSWNEPAGHAPQSTGWGDPEHARKKGEYLPGNPARPSPFQLTGSHLPLDPQTKPWFLSHHLSMPAPHTRDRNTRRTYGAHWAPGTLARLESPLPNGQVEPADYQ